MRQLTEKALTFFQGSRSVHLFPGGERGGGGGQLLIPMETYRSCSPSGSAHDIAGISFHFL